MFPELLSADKKLQHETYCWHKPFFFSLQMNLCSLGCIFLCSFLLGFVTKPANISIGLIWLTCTKWQMNLIRHPTFDVDNTGYGKFLYANYVLIWLIVSFEFA